MTGRAATPAILALAGALLVACGSVEAPAPTTRLTVTLEPTGWTGCQVSTADGCTWTATTTTVTLTCNPAQLTGAGSSARPDAVCDALGDEPALTRATAPTCPGADHRIHVEGLLDGTPVAAALTACLDPRPLDRWFALLDVQPGSDAPPV